MGTIIVAQLRCDGICVPTLWLYDATKGSCDLSSSDHEDIARIGCESTWTWFYETSMIFLWRICADSYESAICGFSLDGIALIEIVI